MTPRAAALYDKYDKTWFANRVAELEEERDEQERSFELYYTASMRGIKMWQEKTGEDMVWPDQGHLIVWLIEKTYDLEEELNLRAKWNAQVSALNLEFAKQLSRLRETRRQLNES